MHVIVKDDIIFLEWRMIMSKKRRVTKASKRRLALFGTLSVAVIVYFFTMLSVYAIKIYNLKEEEAALKENLILLQAKEKSLKTEIDKLKDKEYLAKYARENYQYSKDDELVFQMTDEEEKVEKQPKKININPNYIIGVGGTIIIILFIRFLKKR